MINTNTIWETHIEDGREIKIFKERAYLGVAHFKSLYKETTKENIVEIIKLAS